MSSWAGLFLVTPRLQAHLPGLPIEGPSFLSGTLSFLTALLNFVAS